MITSPEQLASENLSKEELISRINGMLDKAYSIRGSLLKKSISLADQALELSRAINDKRCLSRSQSIRSLCLMITGAYKESMEAAEEAINNYESIGDEKGVADAKYNIAGIYYKTDNPNIGLVFLKECLVTYEKLEDNHNISRVQKAIGTIYEYFGDQKSAVNAYERAIEAGISSGDPNLETNAYNPLSGIYLNSGHVNKALDMVQKSIDMKRQTGDVRGLGFALYGRGKVYSRMDMDQDAENDYLAALEIHEQVNDPLGISMTYNKIAELYIKMERLSKAKEIIADKLIASEQTNSVKLISFKAYHLLYVIAKKEKDHESAVKYLELHLAEKESVINAKTLKVIESYEMINRMKSLEKEAELHREKADVIQKKNLELDSFFHRITHDLKSPVTVLKRIEYVMQEEGDVSTYQDVQADFTDQVRNLEHIMDELVRITRMNHLSEIKEEIDFEKLIFDCINSYKFLVNFDSVRIDRHVEKGISFTAEWALVNAIFQSLIENAIKFADLEKPQPKVSISVKKKTGQLILSVVDNGLGMSEAAMASLQDMFYRPNKQIKGEGLGLFILYRAVENLGGKINFKSTLGTGTTFDIHFPSI
ncbi:MAG: signal transduction histidine kinase [Cyclobacteriaceae bacterium]